MALPVLNYPIINGGRYSFASCRFNITGIPTVGVTSINFDQELDPGQVYSSLPQKIGATTGQLKPTASFDILESEYMQLIPALCAIATGPGATSGYLQARFDMTVSYVENFSVFHTILLRGCKIKKETAAWKNGTEALFTHCDLDLFYILRDGQAPLSTFTSAPAFIAG